MVKRILLGVVVAGLLLAALIYSQRRTEPFKISGFIEADEIRLGSRIGGRVAEVTCQEGQAVTAGAVLVRLETFDLDARRAEAQSQLAARRAELDRLQHGFRDEEIAQAQARVDRLTAMLKILRDGPRPEEINAAAARRDLAVAQLERAQRSYNRVAMLFAADGGAVTREEIDRAMEEVKVAEQTQQVREQEWQLLVKGSRAEEISAARAELEEASQALKLAQNGFRSEEIAGAQAAVTAAEAALAAVDAQLSELKIVAPLDAVVEAIELQPGDLVGANAPVLSLMDVRSLWVRAYLPENRLHLQPEQEVQVTTDSYPGERFRGRVTFISRQAEFTPNNVQTPEERSKQVFRVKVYLLDGLDKLRAGMAADVWLE